MKGGFDAQQVRDVAYKTLNAVKGMGDGLLNKTRTVSLAWILKQVKAFEDEILGDDAYRTKINNFVPGIGWEIAGRMRGPLASLLKDLELTDSDLSGLQLEEDKKGRIVTRGRPRAGQAAQYGPAADRDNKTTFEGAVTGGFSSLKGIAAAARFQIKYVPPKFLKQLAFFIEAGRTVLLTGPAGTGKNTSIEVIARQSNPARKVFRVNMSRHVTDMHLLGGMGVMKSADGGTETRWVDGPVIQAMRYGLDDQNKVVGPASILVIDEVDAAEPDAMMVLQRLCENGGNRGRSLMIAEDGGREVLAHPDFSILFTANTRGRGDTTGLYTARQQLDSAFLNRVDFVYEYTYPDLNKVYGHVVPADFMKKIRTVFLDVQSAIAKGDLAIDFSLRQINSLLFALRAGIPFKDAFDGSCLLPFNPEDAQTIRECAIRQFGPSLDYRYPMATSS